MLKLPGASPVTCPMCRVETPWPYAGGEFDCPSCGSGLRVKPIYFSALGLISIAFAVGIAYALGLRDFAMKATAALLFSPVFALVVSINLRIFPPEVELTGRVGGILHPGERREPSHPAPRVLGAPNEVEAAGPKPSDDSVARVYTPFTPHRTMEGSVIAAGYAALILFTLYTAFEPQIYKVWPEFRATKRGPRDFPITLHLGADELRITNRSSKHWQCTFTLGDRGKHYASTAVDAGVTADLPWANFATVARGPGEGTSEVRLTAARQQLGVYCVQHDGIYYQFDFR